MNKSNLTTVLKALYQFITKRIGEVREAAAKAQSTADTAKSTADTAKSTATDGVDWLTEEMSVRTITNGQYKSSITTAVFPCVVSIGNWGFANFSALTKACFPSATIVGENAFKGCQSMVVAKFPLLTKISAYAFNQCRALSETDFSSVETVGKSAFFGCSSLTKIILPAVTSIDHMAFESCTKLAAIVIKTSTVCSLSTLVFTNTPVESGTGYIYVPDSLVDSYKAATNWSTYAAQIKPLSEYTGG